MTPTFPTFRRIDAIRDFLDNATREGGMEGASREEKQEWVRQALGHVDYESLSREERGLVRQYLRQVSGYSRAQVERHISAFRKSVPKPAVAVSAIPSVSVEVPSAITQPFLSWKKVVIESVVVATISGVAATSLLYGSLLPISKDVPPPSPTERVRVVVRTESGETPTWIGEPRPEVRSPILQRVNERRQERVAVSVERDQSSSSSRAGTRSAAPVTSEQVSSAPSSLKFDPVTRRIIPVVQDLKPSAPDIRPAGTQLLASLRISGTPLDGQIVTYQKGRAVWSDLPASVLQGSDDGRASGVGRKPPGLSTTSHDSAPDDNRGRGGGGGGGGTSGGSTSGGISQADADARYVNVTGDDITGTLTVSSTGVFNGALTTKAALSGASLVVTNLKECDTIDTDSAGNLVCGSDSGGSSAGTFGSGNVVILVSNRFVEAQGDTMTGGLLIQSGTVHGTLPTIDTGLLLEVAGTASGRILHAQDELRSSGALIVRGKGNGLPVLITDMTNGRVGIGIAAPTELLDVNGDTRITGILTLSSPGTVFDISTGNATIGGSLTVDTTTFYVDNSANTVGLGTTTPETRLEIIGVGSGRILHAQDFLSTSGSLLVRSNGTIRGILSGAIIHASSGLRSSGTLAIETTGVFGGALTTKGALSGASLVITNLKSCDTIDTDSNGALVCGSDGGGSSTGTFGSGNVVTLTSRRYVDSSGDTMTGGLLIINGGSGTLPTIDAGLLLEIAGTASGRMLHAQDLLTTSGSLIVRSNGTIRGILSGATIHASTGLRSSGTLVIEGNARIDDTTFVVDATSNRVGIGTSSPENALEVVGTMSGRSLQVTGTGAAPLIFTHIATGDVGIGTATPDLLGTQATSYRLLTVYNSDKTEGSILNLANNGQGEFPGVIQFVDNSNTTGKRLGLMFSQRTGTVPNAGGDLHFGTLAQGAAGTVTRLTIKDGGNVGIGTTAPETILEIIGVGSGRILHAQDFLSTSGSLLVRSNGTIRGILSGATIHASTGLRSSGTLAIETTGVFGGALTSKATISGASLVITDLKNCNTIDTNSNGVLSCGTDDTSAGGGLATSTGSLQTYFGTQFVQIQGDTMTGGLLIVNDGLGTQTIDPGLLLEIAGTASGRMLHAQDLLTTSGSLIVRSNATVRGLLSGATIHASTGLRSSGTLAIEGAARIDDTTFAVDASNNRVGIGTSAPKTTLEVVGTMSGSDVRVAGGAFQISALGLMTLTNQVSTFDVLNIKLSAEDQARFILNADGTMEWGGGSLATDTNLYRSAANILKTDDSLYISGTLSGSQVHAKDILTTSGALIVRNNATVRGILSGATIHASIGLRSSGTLAIETTGVFGGALTTKAALSGASLVITNLKGCDTIDTDASGALSCGTDESGSAGGSLNTSTGSLKTYFEKEFVQIDGDTMTGGLLIVNDGLGTQTIDAGLLLEIAGTASGRVIKAMDTLASSGSLVIHKYAGTSTGNLLVVDAKGLVYDGTNKRVGIGTASPLVALHVAGAVRFSTTTTDDFTTPVGSNIPTKINVPFYDPGAFGQILAMGVDSTAQSTSRVITMADARTVAHQSSFLLLSPDENQSMGLSWDGSNTMSWIKTSKALALGVNGSTDVTTGLVVATTGNVSIGMSTNTAETALEIGGTASGRTLHAQDLLASSGSLIVRSNGTFRGILSGATLHASSGLRSSGTLAIENTGVFGGNLTTKGTLSGGALTIMSGNSYVLGSFGIGLSAAPKTKLEVLGTISGSSLHTTNSLLTSGALSVNGAVLLKNSSITLSNSVFTTCTALETVNGVLTCGTDDTGSAGGSLNTSTGSLKTYFEKEFVQIDGDTMTGGLLIVNDGLGTQTIDTGLLFEVAGSASGRQLHAQDLLRSSGSLVIRGTSTFQDTVTVRGVFSGSSIYAAGRIAGSGNLAIEGNVNIGDGNGVRIQQPSNHTLQFVQQLDPTTLAVLQAQTLHMFAGTSNNVQVTYGVGGIDGVSGMVVNWSSDATNNAAADDVGLTRQAAGILKVSDGSTGFGQIWAGTVSGATVHASAGLRSSGTLAVERTGVFGGALTTKGALSGASLVVTNLKNCNTIDTDASGAFTCGTDEGGSGGGTLNTSTGSLQTYFGTQFVQIDGDTMTGGLLIVNDGLGTQTIDAGLLLEIAGTASGRVLKAMDTLASSGSLVIHKYAGSSTGNLLVVDSKGLVYDGTNKRVGIGLSAPKTQLEVQRTMSGNALYVSRALSGAGLTGCWGTANKLVWSGSTQQFGCQSDQGGGITVKIKTADETVNNSNVLQNDDQLNFAIGASENWAYLMDLVVNQASGTPSFKAAVTAPSGAVCRATLDVLTNGNFVSSASSGTCGNTLTPTASLMDTGNISHRLFGSVRNSTNAGTVQLQWAQQIADLSDTKVLSGSTLLAFKTVGSDLAEIYASRESLIPGIVVTLDTTLRAGVKASTEPYDSHLMGVVSTRPGLIIGEPVLEGQMVFLALAGRVPVLVSTENGPIRPGDYLTSSTQPGIAMRATKPGMVIGQAMEGYDEEGIGVVMTFVKNTHMGGFDGTETFATGSGDTLSSGGPLTVTGSLLVEGAMDTLSISEGIAEEVHRQLAESTAGLESRMLRLESQLTVLSGSVVNQVFLLANEIDSRLQISDLSLSGSLRARDIAARSLSLEDTLAVKDASVLGDLTVGGVLSVDDFYLPNGGKIDGALRVSSLEVQSDMVIDGALTLNGTLNLMKGITFGSGTTMTFHDLVVQNALRVIGPVTIEGLATFLAEVNIKGQLTLSNRQAGFAEIPQSGSSVTIRFDPPLLAEPVVTVTPSGRVGMEWWTEASSATGFTISLMELARWPLRFNWTALAVENPKAAAGASSADLSSVSSESSSSASSEQSSSSAPPEGTPPASIPFPVDANGVPISTNLAWNSCIRRQPLITSDGSPINCWRYRDGYMWDHPDLLIQFTYNTSVSPAILLLPEGYVIEVTEGTEGTEGTEVNGGSSSSASSESSEQSSSVSSDATSSESAVSEASSSAASESSVSSQSSESSSSAASESSVPSEEDGETSSVSASSESSEASSVPESNESSVAPESASSEAPSVEPSNTEPSTSVPLNPVTSESVSP